MKTIVAHICRGWGKTLNYLLIAIFTVAICAAMPSFAADRTISANYTLTADETVDGVLTVESGATVDLAGNRLVVHGLAGGGTITASSSVSDLTAPDPDGARVTWSTKNGTQTTAAGTGLNLFNNNFAWEQDGTHRIVVTSANLPLDVIYDFGDGSPKKIDRYRIYFSSAGSNYIKRGPKDWTFHGSNDKTTWTELDSRTGEAWTGVPADVESRDFDIDSSKVAEYRYYRINFTASSGNTNNTKYLELVQLEYFDTSVQPELHIAVPQGGTSTNSTVEIAGTVRLVKDGSGEFVTSKTGQTYAGGTLLSEGTLGLAGTASLDWSAFTLGTDPAKPVMLDFGPTATLSPVPDTWYVGNVANITSTVVKAGGDWTFSGDVRVGSGAGSVASLYHTGGTISAAQLMVGDDNNSGHAGTGYCEISGGTVTCSGIPMVGTYSEGTLVVTNGGSFVTTANSLYLGYRSAGTLTVADGGSVNLAASVIMCQNSVNAVGILNIGRGGVVSAQNAYRSKTGSATVNFDGGTFRKSSGNGNFFPPTGNNSAINVTVSANGGTLDNNGLSVALPCTITGAGGMTLSGSGTTTVSADQSYLGTTTVSNETTLSVSGGVTFAGPVSLEAGSALDIADYVGGVTPLTATSLAFPASGTVPLTLNGGAFPVGVYAICSASGLTAADGEKFSVSAGDFNTLWSVEDGALVLSVIATTQTWNGAAGESASWNGSGWSGGAWADNADAVFATEGAIASVDSDVAANSVTFNAGATVNGSATLTPNVVFVAEGKEATINAPTAGALEKTGAGTLTLTESRSDATTLSEGTLEMSGAAAMLGWTRFTFGDDPAKPVTLRFSDGAALSSVPSAWYVGTEENVTNTIIKTGGDWSGNAFAVGKTNGTVSTFCNAGGSLTFSGYSSVGSAGEEATLIISGGAITNTYSGSGSYAPRLSIGGSSCNARTIVTNGAALVARHHLGLCVNEGCCAILDVYDGAVESGGYGLLYGWNSANATGVVNLHSGGVICVPAVYRKVEVSATFNFDGGRLVKSILGNGKLFTENESSGAIDVVISGNGGVIDNNGFSILVPLSMTGEGGMTFVGSGKTTISANQEYLGTTTVSNETTLSVSGGVTFAGPVAFAAGSALNIADYVGGVTPLTAMSLAFPASGTVPLTFNGGAFPVGVYAICSASGLTATDGEKFAPSTGGETANWSVEDDTLVLTVGYVNPNAWTGRGGDGRMSTAANWAGNAVPTADADIDLSGISADTTIIADANRTFGAVTMGTGVVTFTNAFAVTSFSDTTKVAVGADSTVTLVGDLVFATNVTACICHSIAAGGMFAVTGDIIASAEHTGYVIPCIGQDSIPGTISCKGIVNNAYNQDYFYIVRAKSNTLANWLVGEDGISGTSRFFIQRSNYRNSYANIRAQADFTVSADIRQGFNLTLDTAGYTITLGTNTTTKSGGILGGAAGGMTTVTGAGRVVVNYNVNDLTTAASSRTNAFTVANGGTLAFAPGGNIGFGDLTVQDGGTLEIQSGTTTFGNLTVEENAILGFNFTDRRVVPQLALYDGAEVTALDPFTVKVSGTVWPSGGEKILTTCGGFDGIPLTLSAVGEAARWAKPDRLSVNGDYNIVLDVKPMGTMILFR